MLKNDSIKRKRKVAVLEPKKRQCTSNNSNAGMTANNSNDGDSVILQQTGDLKTSKIAKCKSSAKRKRTSKSKEDKWCSKHKHETLSTPSNYHSIDITNVQKDIVQASHIHDACLSVYNENIIKCCDDILSKIKSREAEMREILEDQSNISKKAQIENMVHSMVNVENAEGFVLTDNAFTQHHTDKSVEGIRRCWDEMYLMEPIKGEYPCLYSSTNECVATEMFKHDFDESFTLKEFFTPSDIANKKNKGGVKERQLQPCILCLRNDVLASVLRIRSTGETCDIHTQVSRVHNFVGLKGEYLIEHCVCSLPNQYEGLIDPVVMPLKCYFEPHKLNGVRCLNQTIPRPEDVYPDF